MASTSIRPPSVLEIIRAREQFRRARLTKYFEWKRALQDAYDGQAYVPSMPDDGSSAVAALRVPSIIKRRHSGGGRMTGGGAYAHSNMEEGGADLRAARNSVAQMVQRATIASKQAATTVSNMASLASNDVLDNNALLANPATASIVQQLMSTLQQIDTLASGAQLRNANTRQAALVDIQDLAMGAQRLFTDANVAIPYTVARDAHARVDGIINKLQAMAPPVPAQVLASLITVRSRLLPFIKSSGPTGAPGAVQGSYASQLPPGASSSYNGAMGASPSGMAADAISRGAQPPGPGAPPGSNPGSFPPGPPQPPPGSGPGHPGGGGSITTIAGMPVSGSAGRATAGANPGFFETRATDAQIARGNLLAEAGQPRYSGTLQTGNSVAPGGPKTTANAGQTLTGDTRAPQGPVDVTQSRMLARAPVSVPGATTRVPGTLPGQVQPQGYAMQGATALSVLQSAVSDAGLAAARAQRGQQEVQGVTFAAAAAAKGGMHQLPTLSTIGSAGASTDTASTRRRINNFLDNDRFSDPGEGDVDGPGPSESTAASLLRRGLALGIQPGRAAAAAYATAQRQTEPRVPSVRELELMRRLEELKNGPASASAQKSIDVIERQLKTLRVPTRVPLAPPPGDAPAQLPPETPEGSAAAMDLAARLFDVNSRVPTRTPRSAPAAQEPQTRTAGTKRRFMPDKNVGVFRRPAPPQPPVPQQRMQTLVEPEVPVAALSPEDAPPRAPIDRRPDRGQDPQPRVPDFMDDEGMPLGASTGAAEVARAAADAKKRVGPKTKQNNSSSRRDAALRDRLQADRDAQGSARRTQAERAAAQAEAEAMRAEELAVRHAAAMEADAQARAQSEAAKAEAVRDSEARAKKALRERVEDAKKQLAALRARRAVSALRSNLAAGKETRADAARAAAAEAVRAAMAAAARPDGLRQRGESGKKSRRDPEDDREQERERGRPEPRAAAPAFSADGADMMSGPDAPDEGSAALRKFNDAIAVADATGAPPLSDDHYNAFLEAMGKRGKGKRPSEGLKRQYLAEKDPERAIRQGRYSLRIAKPLQGFGSPAAIEATPVDRHVSEHPRFKTVERALA